MPTQPKRYLSPEEYLEIERKAEYKSEYYAGEMFPLGDATGRYPVATERHVVIAINAIVALRQRLRSKGYRVYSNGMGVRVAPDLCIYPDVSAVCGAGEFVDDQNDTLLNPGLIVEVLSPSTEAYDRGRKFDQYKTIPSLTHYVLIASDRVHVDLFTRESEGRWLVTSASGLDAALELPGMEASLSLSELYEDTDLAESANSPSL